MSAGFRDLQVRAQGLRLHVGFALENRSSAAWTGADAVCLGWQLYDPDTTAFLAEGEWTGIGAELPPGAGRGFALPVELPANDGRYHVFVSARSRADGWFFEQQWPFVLVEARVSGGGAAVHRAEVTTLGRLRRESWGRKLRIAFLQPWRTLWRQRRLAGSMARREIAARYRGSMGDVAWTVLHPLLLMLTYFFVFGIVLKSRFGADPSESGYVLNFLAGMLPWLPFNEALGRAPGSMLEHRNFIKKLVFPVETITVSQVLAGLVTQAFALLVFLAMLVLLRGAPPPASALWLPLLVIPQVMLTLGAAWMLAALGVYLRDLGQIIGFLLTLAFFLTPICYPAESLPGWALPWLRLNPMFALVEGFRAVLVHGTAPRLATLAGLWAAGVVALLAGHAGFWRLKKSFADVI